MIEYFLVKTDEEIASDRINKLETEMLTKEQVSCPVYHRFGDGLYLREVHIPAGTVAVGHHQNFEHTNILLKGRVTMFNGDGSTTELAAPMVFQGKPGRKIGFIHEDMIWINVYATEEQDIDALETRYLTKTQGFLDSKSLETAKRLTNDFVKNDFESMLAEIGVSEGVVREQSENLDDQTNLPSGSYKIKVSDSLIEGKGLFATADISIGETIAPARISGKRTIAGRYANHSPIPNAEMLLGESGDIFLVSKAEISGCRGGFDGDEITVDYRQSYKLTRQVGEERCLE